MTKCRAGGGAQLVYCSLRSPRQSKTSAARRGHGGGTAAPHAAARGVIRVAQWRGGLAIGRGLDRRVTHRLSSAQGRRRGHSIAISAFSCHGPSLAPPSSGSRIGLRNRVKYKPVFAELGKWYSVVLPVSEETLQRCGGLDDSVRVDLSDQRDARESAGPWQGSSRAPASSSERGSRGSARPL